LFFLTGRRKLKGDFAATDLQRLCDRVESFLTPRVGRLTLPYLREKPMVDVGYGFCLWSPLENDDRQMIRLVEEARTSADLRRRLSDRAHRESLIEIIHNRHLWTAFQPIVEMETLEPLGHEALSRGPRGSDLESPYSLFTLAHRRYGAPTRLFVNTVPATVRDASFLGRGVLDYLGPSLSPSSVTLEITEGTVIENLNLYREAMHSFLDLGFTFAIDDVGAGYSGLETMASLAASYLKIDMSLVRDIEHKKASQQVVKAILELGNGMGATVIAEGIQTSEEAQALKDMGVRYGQGYLFARPIDPAAALRAADAKAAGSG
jgi:EAL domain-containing protein (putative c-di-GMP-specific phosphodiesterase class I)